MRRDLRSLLEELRKLPRETEWAEFKKDNADPQLIGEYISALSNSAALEEKTHAYMVWGLDDSTHEIVGTQFDPKHAKKGNEELESWLLKLLNPKIDFQFNYVSCENNKTVIILEIKPNFKHPVRFDGIEYIRIGSYKKKLGEFPEKERALWRIFDKIPFEKEIAKDNLEFEHVKTLLDIQMYYELIQMPLPSSDQEIKERMQIDELIGINEEGKYDIYNLGAISFAKSLDKFSGLKRKAIRVITYKDNTRNETLREFIGDKGYATEFKELIEYINALIPKNEIIKKALRTEVSMYPAIAIRELVANAIIHQDFSITGAGPMIEIFTNRIEISNPGKPIVDPMRFIDTPPLSRNEGFASLMRRMGICEERGSGFDKVVFQTELYQLPPPMVEATESNTRVVLFAHKEFKDMNREDRIHACYLHACLKYVNRQKMMNKTLRDRFGIDSKNSAMVSRIINDTVSAGLIKRENIDGSKKYSQYIPFWA